MPTPAQRQAAYRLRHPERVKAARIARRPLDRIKDAEYRKRVGTHPMNKSGTPEYVSYRNSDKYRETYLRGHLRRKYGLSLERFEEMLSEQGGVCKICSEVDSRNWKDGRRQLLPLCVDHNHQNGKVRGLLCNKCNVAIALFKDNLDILASAILYLTESEKEVSRL